MTPARGLALASLPLVAAAPGAIVARLSGSEVPLMALIPAAVWLFVAIFLAAALAAHAVLRRRWLWGVGLVVAWPVTVPIYLWRSVTPT